MEDVLPSEIRTRMLVEHAELRALTSHIRRASLREGSLVPQARGLVAALRAHIDREEELLVPTLRGIDAWGPERARRVTAWHLEMRDRIMALENALVTPQPNRYVIEFVDTLERDLAEAERQHLAADVLRELPIAADLGGD